MRKVVWLLGVVLLLPGVAMLLFLPTAQAETRHVDPEDPEAYDTIQAAVDEAAPGDTIRIHEGTFEGPVHVAKDGLTLQGSGPGATVIRTDSQPGLNLTGDGLKVASLSIDGASDGILAHGTENLTVRDVTVTSATGNSFDVALAQQVTVTDVTSRSAGSNGLRLASVDGLTVEGASLSGDHRSLHAWDVADATLTNLTASSPAEHGVVVERSQDLVLLDTEADGTIGYWILASSNVTLRQASTDGASRHGILIEDARNITVQEVRASDAGVNGLITKRSTGIDILSGTYTGNLRGIHLLATDDVRLQGLSATRSTEHGIVAEDVAGLDLSDLHIETARRGLWLIATPGARVNDVAILDASDDLVNLTGSPDVKVRNATIQDSWDEGFHVFDSPGLDLRDSTIEDTACDLFFRGEATATARQTSLSTTNNASRLSTDLPGSQLAPCRVEHTAQAIDDHPCDATEWHFVINQLEQPADAPHQIIVTWGTSFSEEVALDETTTSTAHYTTAAHLDAELTEARADLPASWDGRFVLSHGPCHGGSGGD